MDPAQALSDLTEISSQVEAVVVLEDDGSTLASTLEGARADELAQGARELLAAVERAAGDAAGGLTQVEVATRGGSVFLVRDGERTIAATTRPEPTIGLVFYDLKSCLRSLAAKEKPRPERTTRRTGGDAAA